MVDALRLWLHVAGVEHTRRGKAWAFQAANLCPACLLSCRSTRCCTTCNHIAACPKRPADRFRLDVALSLTQTNKRGGPEYVQVNAGCVTVAQLQTCWLVDSLCWLSPLKACTPAHP